MRRTCRPLAVLASLALVGVTVGCSGTSHGTPEMSAAARKALRNVLAICGAHDEAAAKAAGGGGALEADVNVLIAEAKRLKDPTIVQGADDALRAGGEPKLCDPSLANTIDIALLPRMPEEKVQSAGVSSGLPIFRKGAMTYYAENFGAGESRAQIECVTTSGALFEHEDQLENFLYLLHVRNEQAERVLGHLRDDCRAKGL